MEGIDAVVHLAPLKQVPAAEYNPIELINTNVIGGENVVQACLYMDIRRVVALALISYLTSVLSVPVISSGGCGLVQHFVEGYKQCASGVAAGTFFCLRDQNPMQCRSYISNAGFPVRLLV